MRFGQLLAAAGVPHRRRGGDVEVTGIADDSRRCEAGTCFVAVRGCESDGHAYISAALAGGASAVVCEDPAGVDPAVPCAVVTDGRGAAGPLAQAFLDWPARKMVNVGITGTNGKTTIAALLGSILQAAGHNCGQLGTITYDTGISTRQAGTTTPGPVELAALTDEMVRAGRTHMVMEVSSHALDQQRTAGVEFDVGVFTNLSGDHLDYHKTMGAYLAAKRKLFEQLSSSARAVVNRDDPAGAEIAAGTDAAVLWYGLDDEAALRGRIDRIDAGGTHFAIIYQGVETPVATALIGQHNVENCLAAAGAAVALGVSIDLIAEVLASVGSVRGRLERVGGRAPFAVFVDYAHTDDALANVLAAVRPLADGRVILVFGCGGNRDRKKRPRMALAAERGAGQIVVTSDNPRSEDPGEIIDEILAGFTPEGRKEVRVEPDRAAAIAWAIRSARAGDVVLIAGKGHEDYQIVGDSRVHFDDVETAAMVLAERQGVR